MRGEPPREVRSPVPAPHVFYDAVGRVTVEAAAVEQTLLMVLMWVIQDFEVAARFNAAALPELTALGRRTVKAHAFSGPRTEEFLALLERADALHLRRNGIVHSVWTFGTDDRGKQRYLGHKPEKRKLGLRTVTSGDVHEIRQLAAELYVLQEDLMHLGAALFGPADLPPFPEPSRGKVVNPHGHTPTVGPSRSARRRSKRRRFRPNLGLTLMSR